MKRQLTHLEMHDCKFTEFSEDVFVLIDCVSVIYSLFVAFVSMSDVSHYRI